MQLPHSTDAIITVVSSTHDEACPSYRSGDCPALGWPLSHCTFPLALSHCPFLLKQAFPIYRSGTLPDPGMATDHTVVFDLCKRTCAVRRGASESWRRVHGGMRWARECSACAR